MSQTFERILRRGRRQGDRPIAVVRRVVGSLGAIALLVTLLWSSFSPPAAASIHTYPDATTQSVTYRSLQSLRDEEGFSWQLVLYKRVKAGRVQRLRLRLVGFPGRTIARPTPLDIQAATVQAWQAPDVSATALRSGTLPENAAEYDVATVLQELETDAAMRLSLALVRDEGTQAVEIPVPPAIVREWRSLAFSVGTSPSDLP